MHLVKIIIGRSHPADCIIIYMGMFIIYLFYIIMYKQNYLPTYCLQDSFPLRVKTVHYINPPKFMSRLITFFKLFVSNKIRDRVSLDHYSL